MRWPATRTSRALRADVMAVVDLTWPTARWIRCFISRASTPSSRTGSPFLWNNGHKVRALPPESRVVRLRRGHPSPGAHGPRCVLRPCRSIVIGATAVIEDDVSILQGVTLGGTGKATAIPRSARRAHRCRRQGAGQYRGGPLRPCRRRLRGAEAPCPAIRPSPVSRPRWWARPATPSLRAPWTRCSRTTSGPVPDLDPAGLNARPMAAIRRPSALRRTPLGQDRDRAGAALYAEPLQQSADQRGGSRAKPEGSAEVFLGEEAIGTLDKDEEDGELSYHFRMPVLDKGAPRLPPHQVRQPEVQGGRLRQV